MKPVRQAVRPRRVERVDPARLLTGLEAVLHSRQRGPGSLLKGVRRALALHALAGDLDGGSGRDRHLAPWRDLLAALEERQRWQRARRALRRELRRGCRAAAAWLAEWLERRCAEVESDLARRAENLLAWPQPWRRLTTFPSRLPGVRVRAALQGLRQDLRRARRRCSGPRATASDLRGLRRCLRAYRLHLELAGEWLVQPLPFDPRLLAEGAARLKRLEPGFALADALRQAEAEFNSRPRAMARQWVDLFAEVDRRNARRIRRMTRELAREKGGWSGLGRLLASSPTPARSR